MAPPAVGGTAHGFKDGNNVKSLARRKIMLLHDNPEDVYWQTFINIINGIYHYIFFIVAKHFPDISGIVALHLCSLKTKTHSYVSFLESYYDYDLVHMLCVLVMDTHALSKINESPSRTAYNSVWILKHIDVSLGLAGILLQQSPSFCSHPWHPGRDGSSFLTAKWQWHRVTCDFGHFSK